MKHTRWGMRGWLLLVLAAVPLLLPAAALAQTTPYQAPAQQPGQTPAQTPAEEPAQTPAEAPAAEMPKAVDAQLTYEFRGDGSTVATLKILEDGKVVEQFVTTFGPDMSVMSEVHTIFDPATGRTIEVIERRGPDMVPVRQEQPAEPQQENR